MTHPEADMADYLVAQSKRELQRRRPAVSLMPETAKAIDLSGIYRMTAEQIDRVLREFQEVA